MSRSRSLPIIMPDLPDQRWSCHSCAACCRTLVVQLFDTDRARLDEQVWSEALGGPSYVRAGGHWVLNRGADGACIFLNGEGLCRIHARFGEAAKPLACRIFPFSVRKTAGGWQLSIRFDCPSVAASRGEPIKQHRAWLAELVRQIYPHARAAELSDVVLLQRKIKATPEEVAGTHDLLERWIGDDTLAMNTRLTGIARLVTTLSGATLAKVRGPRFAELLELLFAALPREAARTPGPPSPRQCAMLRQLAFAHAEHVTVSELRAGPLKRVRKRWQQLRRGRRFRLGIGSVPPLPGMDLEDTPFDAVESVAPAVEDAERIDDLLARYLVARLQDRTVCGAGYYGWSLLDGLAALCLAPSVAGFLARTIAAGKHHPVVTFEDLSDALGIVDRAATRLPALGTVAERARIRYLLQEDGLAKLLSRYAPSAGAAEV